MKTKLTASCIVVLVALTAFVAYALDGGVVATRPAKEANVEKPNAGASREKILQDYLRKQHVDSRTLEVSKQSILYSEKFDAGAPGWTFQDLWSESFWHVSTTGAYSGKSYWCGIEELGGYDDKWLQILTSPAIDLTGTISPTLTFMHNYSVEPAVGAPAGADAWDAITVRISTDSVTFNVIQPVGGYPYSKALGFYLYYGTGIAGWAGASNGYVKPTFNLSAYAGKKVWIRFEFGTDWAGSYENNSSFWGWRVDNIEITDGATRVFFDDAGDTGTAQFVAGGPGGPSLWHITSNAAVSAPNSVGCFDPATGSYQPRMKAGLVSPVIAINALPPGTKKLLSNFQIQGFLDPSGNADFLAVEARKYSGGVWSYWRKIGGDGGGATYFLPDSFLAFNEWLPNQPLDASAFIGADSMQFRIFLLTAPDGVVPPANVFLDDFTLFAESGADSIRGPKFSAFLNRVTAAPASARAAVVDSFMTTITSFPLIEEKTIVYFLYRGTAGSVFVPGDANEWNTNAFPMTKIADTNLWYRQEIYEPDARLEYQFYRNGTSIADPLNLNRSDAVSVLAMPDYVPPLEIEFYPTIPHGALRDTTISSRFLGYSRNINVYTPPYYENMVNTSFPVVLFYPLSGETVANVLNYLISENRMQPVIAVFLPFRGDEFQIPLKYESFIIKELMPLIDARYRTKRDPANRAMFGFSGLGFYTTKLCFNYPESFGLCGAYSAPYDGPEGAEIFRQVLNGPKKNIKFYLDWGKYDYFSIMATSRAMRNSLIDHGYEVKWNEWHEGHTVHSWSSHLDNALEYFFPAEGGGVKDHDLMVTSFPEHLQRVPILANVVPKALIMNAGLNDESNLSVNCRIDSAGVKVYSDVQTIAQLRSLEAKEVTFKSWRAYEAKNYTISFYPTKLANEENVLNDTLRTTVAVSNLVDDFESGFAKWSSSTGWGVTKERFHSGQFSMEDSPGASYGNNVNSAVTCNFSFDLSKLNAAHLSYWTWNYIRPNDFGYVEVSVDSGKSWKQLGASYSGVRIWTQDSLSLTPYCGPGFNDIRIRFRLITDSSLVSFGWSLDDIEIHVGDIQTAVAENAGESLPTEYTLLHNYPNPFNPQTFIEYQLPRAGKVRLVVFNLNGQVIRTLVDAPQQAGRFKSRWDGRDDLGNGVASGVYLYQLQAGDFSQTKKMILLR